MEAWLAQNFWAIIEGQIFVTHIFDLLFAHKSKNKSGCCGRKSLSFHLKNLSFHFDKHHAKFMQNIGFSMPSLLLTIIGNQLYYRTGGQDCIIEYHFEKLPTDSAMLYAFSSSFFVSKSCRTSCWQCTAWWMVMWKSYSVCDKQDCSSFFLKLFRG